MFVPKKPVMSKEELESYVDRVNAAMERFSRLPVGTKQKASFDLRIPPSRVSGVLLIREVNDDILARLESWLDAEEASLAK